MKLLKRVDQFQCAPVCIEEQNKTQYVSPCDYDKSLSGPGYVRNKGKHRYTNCENKRRSKRGEKPKIRTELAKKPVRYAREIELYSNHDDGEADGRCTQQRCSYRCKEVTQDSKTICCCEIRLYEGLQRRCYQHSSGYEENKYAWRD